MRIDAYTRTVFVVADPVVQLRTPESLNSIWEERGINAVTVPAQVASTEIQVFLESIRSNRSAMGAVISLPHKQSAFGLCDKVGANATLTGAINAIRREKSGLLVGETFDGAGFLAGLLDQGIKAAGMKVILVGAGGAASSIAVALARSGVQSIDIVNRTPSRAEALAERLRKKLGFAAVDTGWKSAVAADLVINCTSSGMSKEDELHIPVSELSPTAIAAEVIVSKVPTPFLQAAQQRGLRIHEGRHMLNGQMQLIADYLIEGNLQ